MSFPVTRVTLVGLGLMGGSLARSLKRVLPTPPQIHGISRDPSELDQALALGILDSGSGPMDALPGEQDLVVYATPLQAALTLMERHGPQLRGSGAVVTDLVSLKAPVAARAMEMGIQARYVGSHPMVGGTGSGFTVSREDLYAGAPVWVVPGEGGEEALATVEELWKAVGARPTRIGAQEHDGLMAWVSHLPQLTANALALALEGAGLGPRDLGPGGLDMTRLAGSSPEMWIDLLRSAPPGLAQALRGVEEELGRIRELLEKDDLGELEALLARTRQWREGP